MESILMTIRSLLGIGERCSDFDKEIIPLINSALMRVATLGIGPTTGLVIFDEDALWSDLLGTRTDLEGVKTYIWQKVRLKWDPPQMGYLVTAMEKQLEEDEWILLSIAEGGATTNG